ncbi:uncharacterized protein CG7065 [Anastrepha obliqua]|uniref:uncharacterized protein CG7065 n=1 Tax=Anastrepha obliqua TaxID=95512 RepID=UPI00240A5F64|nr:uncharacterized protein CG7065 [Anastrepha obliqua]
MPSPKIKGGINYNVMKSSMDVHILEPIQKTDKQYSPKESEKFSDKSEEPDVLPTVIAIDDYKEDCLAEEEEANSRAEDLDKHVHNEPPTKKIKMVLNPAAVHIKKVDETIKAFNADDRKPKYQSNINILPTNIKHKEETCVALGHSSKPAFSTKKFSCNRFDDDLQGLVGVEYVVKINKPNHNQSNYECGLCEVTDDGLGMQNHLLGYNHRLKFCERHFPTALRQYRQYIRNVKPNEVYKVMTPILKRLAIGIEQHHGRDLPYECLENEFNINRHEILSKVFSSRHASEQNGPTFTHIIDSKEVDALISDLDKYQPPPNISKKISFDLRANATPFKYQNTVNRKRVNCNSYVDTGHEAQSYNSLLHRYDNVVVSGVQTLDIDTHKLMVDDFLKNTCKQPFRPRHSSSRHISPVWKLSSKHKSLSPLRENNIGQAYRHFVDQKVMELNELFQIYRNNPETHPDYDQEWEMFWKRRKNELIVSGLDHRTYNYQPEWVRFFNIRIEELYNQAVENIKIDARERLYLPMSNENPLDEKMNDMKTAADFEYNKHPIKELKFGIEEYTTKPQVVSVLRLLTALEAYLGSLGPKIVELLSKALQVEKNNPSQLDSLIMTSENCSLLETAMEKFKGIIITDILDDVKQKVLRKAVDQVRDLLYQNANRLKKSDSITNWAEIPKQNYISSKNQLFAAQVDKKELALKLSNLLAAQGKTDIDPIQLQKIISVYMLIEKKKQESLIISKGESGDLLNQKNICDQTSGNYSRFFEPSRSQGSTDSQFPVYGNKHTDIISSENLSNVTFCNSNHYNSNGSAIFANSYQQYMNSGGSQSRQQVDAMTKNINWTTHSPKGQNKRNNKWNGNNSHWRKF